MRYVAIKSILLGMALTIAGAACGDVEPAPGDQADNGEREQAVTVVPEFEIEGTSSLPEELHLDQLGLTISEIRLEPLGPEHESVAYSTREPDALTFAIAEGETVKRSGAIELPHAGEYLVNVRLEPITEVEEGPDGASEKVHPSFSVSGFVAGETELQRIDPRYGHGKYTDGKPIPLPYDEDDVDSDDVADSNADDVRHERKGWTPFDYQSERSIFLTLDEVEFKPGEQVLAFEFDVEEWALELVEPLLSAIAEGEDVSHQPGGIDVTDPLDSHGHGAESLFDNARVSSMQ